MAVFPIKIIQTYKASREITVFVEAADFESAMEEVASGSFNTPSFEDPTWVTSWDLQNEEYERGDDSK